MEPAAALGSRPGHLSAIDNTRADGPPDHSRHQQYAHSDPEVVQKFTSTAQLARQVQLLIGLREALLAVHGAGTG